MQENIQLKDYTTFKIGGNALYFTVARTVGDIKKAVIFARDKKLPFFVLGGGSNIVVSDNGIQGVVIKNEIKGIEYTDANNVMEVQVGAGENWDVFVEETVKKELYGLENLSAIPGTVGAAPVQNIGAYGTEVKSSIKEVIAFNTETGELENFTNAECGFGYRDSIFKKLEGKKYIIISVVFLLDKKGHVDISYRDVKNFFESKQITNPTLKEVRNAIIEIRSRKLPDLRKYGTAGSFFKNPIITNTHYELLKKEYPLLPSYSVDEAHVKIPLAWILDNVCGFKGYKKENVGVYENQALVLVNFGNARAEEIKKLSQEIIFLVKEKTNIEVETEVQFV